MRMFNLKNFLALVMFFLSARVILISSDFLTGTILLIFDLSILTHDSNDV